MHASYCNETMLRHTTLETTRESRHRESTTRRIGHRSCAKAAKGGVRYIPPSDITTEDCPWTSYREASASGKAVLCTVSQCLGGCPHLRARAIPLQLPAAVRPCRGVQRGLRHTWHSKPRVNNSIIKITFCLPSGAFSAWHRHSCYYGYC